MRRPFVAFAAAAALALVAGCLALTSHDDPWPCNDDGDCENGHCVPRGLARVCVPRGSCESYLDCNAPESCVDGKCVPPDESLFGCTPLHLRNCRICATAAECGGYACSFGRCLTTCSSNDECNAEFACREARCASTSCAGVSCGDYACVDGQCLGSCTTPQDCVPGKVCKNGACSAPPPAECAGTPTPCASISLDTCASVPGCSVGDGCPAGLDCSKGDHACGFCGGSCTCDKGGVCIATCRPGPQCSGTPTACASLPVTTCGSTPGCSVAQGAGGSGAGGASGSGGASGQAGAGGSPSDSCKQLFGADCYACCDAHTTSLGAFDYARAAAQLCACEVGATDCPSECGDNACFTGVASAACSECLDGPSCAFRVTEDCANAPPCLAVAQCYAACLP